MVKKKSFYLPSFSVLYDFNSQMSSLALVGDSVAKALQASLGVGLVQRVIASLALVASLAPNVLLAETETVALSIQRSGQTAGTGGTLRVLVVALGAICALGARISRFAHAVTGVEAFVYQFAVWVTYACGTKCVTLAWSTRIGVVAGDPRRTKKTFLA